MTTCYIRFLNSKCREIVITWITKDQINTSKLRGPWFFKLDLKSLFSNFKLTITNVVKAFLGGKSSLVQVNNTQSIHSYCPALTLWCAMQDIDSQGLMLLVLAVDDYGKQMPPLGRLLDHLWDGAVLRDYRDQNHHRMCLQLPLYKLPVIPGCKIISNCLYNS